MSERGMDLDEAINECRRWLEYTDQTAKRSVALAKIAADLRSGRIDRNEARRMMSRIDGGFVVYDGAKLAAAVAALIAHHDKEPVT